MDSAKVAVATGVVETLDQFNRSYGTQWAPTTPWTGDVAIHFTNFVNNNLFPKLSETKYHEAVLGDAWSFATKNDPNIASYDEEYAFLDVVPRNLNMSKGATSLFKRNYKNIMTNLYGPGNYRMLSFSLESNYTRRNFTTIGDACAYAIGAYKHCIQMVNIDEERQKTAKIIDYANKNVRVHETATSLEDMAHKLNLLLMNMTSNSDLYNEACQMTGNEWARYTTTTDMSNLMILTTTDVKEYMLGTLLANTYQTKGIDITNMIMAFPTLKYAWKAKEDITMDAGLVKVLHNFGDEDAEIGDIMPKDSVITIDPETYLKEYKDKFEPIEPLNAAKASGKPWALVFDTRCLKFARFTDGMVEPPFINPAVKEYKYYMHYYHRNNISPFYNKAIVSIG